MTEPTGVRVSDQDRERAAEEIRQHFAAGRLTDEELSDRLSAVYRARTSQELQELRRDLPKLPPTPAEQRAELVQRRTTLQRHLLQQTGGSVGVFLLCTAIWVSNGASGQFWPMWVALVAVLALARNAWRLYGPAPELDKVEAELTRRNRRAIERTHRHDERTQRRSERRGGGPSGDPEQ
jgi:uncharacterized membrane protein YccC